MELGITLLMAVLIAALCGLIAWQIHQTDVLKRLSAGLQMECAELTKQYIRLDKEVEELKELLPRDNKGEIARHELLLSKINDEMETSLRLEQQWNQGVQSILGYGRPIVGEDNKT